jgi:hypothetical protein
MRQSGIYLDGDPAVHSVRGVVGRAQNIARPSHIAGCDHPDRFVDTDAAAGQILDLRAVGVAARERPLEDCRVGRDTDHVRVASELGEASRYQSCTAEIVQPHRDPHFRQRTEVVSHGGHRMPTACPT